jgi:dTMP kinase
MAEPSPGQLVVFEGIDGVGKSSVAAGLVQRLRADGVNAAFVSRDVVAASAAAACRLRSLADLLWGYDPGVDLTALGDRHLILLMASWFALFDESALRPALLRHRIVVTDQSPRKYIARFLANGHEDVAPLFAGLRAADLVLHLDVDAATAAARKVSIRRTECGAKSLRRTSPTSSSACASNCWV